MNEYAGEHLYDGIVKITTYQARCTCGKKFTSVLQSRVEHQLATHLREHKKVER